MKWWLTLLLLWSHLSTAGRSVTELETSVCGWINEPLAFWMFRNAAGNPDPRRLRELVGVERLTHVTTDGRRLGGYRLRSENPGGYLLVAQGNAMLADQILKELAFFRELGLDVYVFDYRGYGMSEGKSRLQALVSDYRELVQSLNEQGYRRRYLYGISMGGIILLDSVGRSTNHDALVVDSSPARISIYGCPRTYDPVENLPEDASDIMIILGLKDTVVPPGQIEPLAREVRQRGGVVQTVPQFSHPFQDLDPAVRRLRFEMVADFLLSR